MVCWSHMHLHCNTSSMQQKNTTEPSEIQQFLFWFINTFSVFHGLCFQEPALSTEHWEEVYVMMYWINFCYNQFLLAVLSRWRQKLLDFYSPCKKILLLEGVPLVNLHCISLKRGQTVLEVQCVISQYYYYYAAYWLVCLNSLCLLLAFWACQHEINSQRV